MNAWFWEKNLFSIRLTEKHVRNLTSLLTSTDSYQPSPFREFIVLTWEVLILHRTEQYLGSQPPKIRYYGNPIISNDQKRQTYTDREISCSGLGDIGRKGQVTTKGYRVSFWGDKNILKLTVIMVARLCEYIIKLLNCTL